MKVFSALIAWFWRTALRTRRREMITRVQSALHLDRIAAEHFVRTVYRQLSTSLVECLMLALKPKTLRQTTIRGWGHLVRLKSAKRGFVVITAHTGNWELLTHLDYLCGINGGFVSKRFHWSGFERLLQWTRRESLQQFDVSGSARLLVKALIRGQSLGFAVDQHTNNARAINYPFLGMNAWWTTAPARLARLADVPVVPIRVYRDEGDTVVEIGAPLRYEWTENRDEDVRAVTEWYAEIVEGWV
ncbi:MAG: lysophospholipid acyltransferase family protein, partial [Bradymonadia bacterium]